MGLGHRGSVLNPGSGLSLPRMCPGKEGGYRLLECSPNVSRRLATEAGFVEAALQKIFSINPLCVMVHKGEAFPQGGKVLGHREVGHWAEAQSRSWTGMEAVRPRTERGQWRARLGSCWKAAIEQKRLTQLAWPYT